MKNSIFHKIETPCYFYLFPDLSFPGLKSKHCNFQIFPKLNSTFTWIIAKITRLAVILKFPYLCCYGVSITKEFVDKQVKCKILTANKSVHAHGNSKHWNNMPFIDLKPHFDKINCDITNAILYHFFLAL